MKDFTNTTKTRYSKGGAVKCGCAGAAAEASALREFKGRAPVRKANGGAVNRGNRSQSIEAREEARMLREAARPSRANLPRYTEEQAAPTRRGPRGAGFNGSPVVPPASQLPLGALSRRRPR